MLITEMQDRVIEGRVREGGLTNLEADSLRRLTSFSRDAFDEFLLLSTRYCFYEGDPDNFRNATSSYASLIAQFGENDARPTFIPESTFVQVKQYLKNYGPGRGFPYDSSDASSSLFMGLLFTLGGGTDDPVIAGQRTYSRMMAARISDGFSHPAIGGHIWGKYLAIQTGPLSGGPEIEIMREVGRAAQLWVADQHERPRIERLILDHAHAHRWPQTV